MKSEKLQGFVFDRYRHFQKLSDDAKETAERAYESLKTEIGLATTPVGKTIDLLQSFLSKSDFKECTAKTLLEHLVLGGYVAVVEQSQNRVTQLDHLADFHNYASMLPLMHDVVSVWSVRHGANHAGTLTRMGKITSEISGESVYVVVNEITKSLYLFSSDTAFKATKVLSLSNALVQFDGSVKNGVLVSMSSDFEVLTFDTKAESEEWLNSILNAGATYREAHNKAIENVNSFYELNDRDMHGHSVSMSQYKGKVILVVNVSSNCGLTPINYPELVQLDEKYREQGLQILGFPCNQFAGQEPGTHEEIVDFVKQYNVQFPLLEKADVNGFDARPVFTFLKAKVPGVFGDFVKWNFTKFLIDHNGNAYKRYAPRESPLSFESDIKHLLEKKLGN